MSLRILFGIRFPVSLGVIPMLLVLTLLGTAPLAAREAAQEAARETVPAGTAVGWLLFDPDTGAALGGEAADRPFIPASVAKLPTVAAALAILGPEHRFTTRLLAAGPLEDGALRGDLILQGGGDPSLDSRGLAQLVDGLRAAGLRRVEGRFLVDATALPDLPEIDAGQPWAAPYNTGVGALSINYNRALLAWRRPAGGGLAVEALSVAETGRLPLDSVTASAGPGPAQLLPDPSGGGPDRWRVAPPPGGSGAFWVPVARPAAAAGALLRRLAEGAGIALPAAEPGIAPATARPLAAVDSPPLAELARGLLRHSNNLSAEVIGLSAARRLDPGVATLDRSAAVLQGWLTRRPGQSGDAAPWRGLRLANHSGLGTGSRATPRQIAALLRAGGPALWDLLPGEEDGKALPPGVRAKSGTLAYVKGLAGTLTAASGRRLGFVLFIADPARRTAMDAALDTELGRRETAPPPDSRAWAARARALQDGLLAMWVSTH